jgi:flagellar hook-length control protein FliK
VIITPTRTPPAALPPSIVGGGNAPSKSQASADRFANYIAQISGGDGADVAGQTQTEGSAPGSRIQGVAGTNAVAADVALATDDGDNAAPVVAVPAWLWAVLNQPAALAAAPLTLSSLSSSPTGTTSAATDTLTDSRQATVPGGANMASLSGVPLAELSPGMPPPSLTGSVGQTASPPVQADSSSPTAATGVATGTSALPTTANSPTAADAAQTTRNAGVELSKNGSLTSTSQTATPATAAGPDQQTGALTTSATQPEPAASAVKTPRAGRAPSAYADAAGLSASPVAGQRDRASLRGPVAPPAGVAAGATPADSPLQAALSSARTADTARPGAANLGPAPTDGQSALAAALTPSRTQNQSAYNQAGHDSPQAFADSKARADEALLPSAQALDESVGAAAIRADHISLPAGAQAVENGHTPSLEKTTLTSALAPVPGSAERSAAIDDGNLHRQIVQAIQLQSHNGVSDARMTLQPEYLGEVTIALTVANGAVTAHVSAAAADVRAWLGANEGLLRQGLSQQGLTLDRLIVSEEPAEAPKDTRDHTPHQQQPQPEEQPRPQRRRDTGTFEITV